VTGTPQARARLESIDLVRGIAMVLMALDHTRDFFGIPGQNPTNLVTASAALFLTRWVTNICAPVFFLLTGTSACLALRRMAPAALSRFLVARGLWLIVLELVLVRCVVYQFNADYRVTMLLVLWALGWSMIVLGGLVRLPSALVTGVGVALILGHDLLDGVRSAHPLWVVLHGQGFLLRTPVHVVFVAYPLVPWIGVTAAGYGLGHVYAWDRARRRAFLRRLGLALCAAFVALRALNLYGDPRAWAAQGSALLSVLSFVNTSKYPPSLLFLLMTLGPAALLLWAAEGTLPPWLRPVVVFGRVPLCYYVGHFLLIHMLAAAVCAVQYGTARWMFESPDLGHYPFSAPPGWGWNLPAVYLVWVAVVAAMYPLCRWYAALKQRRADPWLSYL